MDLCARRSKAFPVVDGLIAHWDFQTSQGGIWQSTGEGSYCLAECGGNAEVVDDEDGPFGSRAIRFGNGVWLECPRSHCPGLNIHGPKAEVSLVAWIKRSRNPGEGCEAIAGMWNEHGQRQYGLFLNLLIHDSAQQVGAHVSAVGGPTPGHRYCMDAAIGARPVPFDVWQCVAMTYGRGEARAYLNGLLDERPGRNPYPYAGGIFAGGPEGANFTVGAVARPQYVDMQEGRAIEVGHIQANLFHGLIGGLAVYDRALGAEEIFGLAALIKSDVAVALT